MISTFDFLILAVVILLLMKSSSSIKISMRGIHKAIVFIMFFTGIFLNALLVFGSINPMPGVKSLEDLYGAIDIPHRQIIINSIVFFGGALLIKFLGDYLFSLLKNDDSDDQNGDKS